MYTALRLLANAARGLAPDQERPVDPPLPQCRPCLRGGGPPVSGGSASVTSSVPWLPHAEKDQPAHECPYRDRWSFPRRALPATRERGWWCAPRPSPYLSSSSARGAVKGAGDGAADRLRPFGLARRVLLPAPHLRGRFLLWKRGYIAWAFGYRLGLKQESLRLPGSGRPTTTTRRVSASMMTW